jgi:hypothetical protein
LISDLLQIQSTIVPEVVLKEWAQRTYKGAADYWTFRKQVSQAINQHEPDVSGTLFCRETYTASVSKIKIF